MRCPIDGAELLMSDRAGVEIDYCPKCRGVWLDRGELDKIIERSASPVSQPRPQKRSRDDDSHGRKSYHDKDHYKRKRRKSILEEIFDFD